MELQFKTRNPKQLEAAGYWIDDETEQLLYGGAKGGGKSFLGATLIFGDALIYPGTHFFIARQELNDLVKFTIPTIHEVFKNWGITLEDYGTYNGQDKAFYLNNGSKVFLIACKEIPSDPLYERFGSMQMTRGWIEEAGEVAEAAKANLWLSIGRWMNQEYKLKKKLLLTANPKKNYLKREFVDPLKAVALPPSRKYVQALPTDNVYLPEDYIATLSSETNRTRRQRLFEGDWDYDEDKGSMVTYDALSDLFTNVVSNRGKTYMTVDVARHGEDRTVISVWKDLSLHEINIFTKQGTEQTELHIREIATQHRVPYSQILIDEDGIGGGVVDHLLGVKGFVANSSALLTLTQVRMKNRGQIVNELTPRTNFANLKTQCAFKLAELINEHKLAVEDSRYRDDIMTELSAILVEKDMDSDKRLQLRPKDDVKQEIGHSPDIGDTMLMRAWFELKNESTGYNDEEQAIHLGRIQSILDRNEANASLNSAR